MNRRILLVDDNQAIHADFAKILGAGRAAGRSDGLAHAMSAFFEDARTPAAAAESYELDSALQGEEALAKVTAAKEAGRPYALAFVDVRMPPGLDGVSTIERLWQVDPELQVVICTAYADYSRDEMIARLGLSDRLLILKKPFDPVEIVQLASALTEKWNIGAREGEHLIEIQRYAAELEGANAELAVARDRAEAATRAKSTFLANVSHELRTPMIAILGYAEMLADTNISEQERSEHAATVRRSGRHLLSIVDDILDLSRIEAGRLRIEALVCTTYEIVGDVLNLVRERAAQKSIELVQEQVGTVPEHFLGDAVRLRQVLLNLVGNAIKFTERGSVRVRLSAEAEGEGWRVRFDVIDTGIGMAPEDVQRLFEPFMQVDESFTRRFGGSGLGLALSRRLAHAMGGELSVKTSPGAGSTFTFETRVGRVRDALLLDEPPSALPSSNAPVGFRTLDDARLNARVLLAEDVPSTQKLYSVYLGKAGVEIEVVSDGREAVERVAAAEAAGRPFDLVLMDMQMPVLDGYRATQELRRAGCDLPIVALTAHAMKGDRERCLEAGCTDYATKPIQREELVDLCRGVLSKIRGAAHPS